MNASRIPAYNRTNPDGMLIWFAEMADRDLIFHPEDSPREIVRIEDGTPFFTANECKEIESIMSDMHSEHGDKVIDACYPAFMRKAGFMVALDS